MIIPAQPLRQVERPARPLLVAELSAEYTYTILYDHDIEIL